MESGLLECHILVVDDDEKIRTFCSEVLKANGFRCTTSGDAKQAVTILERKDIDLVLTDIVMPGLSELDIIERIREISDCHVIAFTCNSEYGYAEAIQKGANDFMTKPLKMEELLNRVSRALGERKLIKEKDMLFKDLEMANQQLLRYGEDLNLNFQQLKVSHKNLQLAYLETIQRLVIAAEFKDEDTADHIIRMSRYCALLAEKLGLPPGERENIIYASPMHDVGKIGIPDSILMKPDKLNQEEWTIMKTHTSIGEKILAGSTAEVIALGADIALSHHEKWNGEGYPMGLSGERIPLCGRIAAVADVFDALSSQRPYKKALPLEKTLDIMREGRGIHFDPQILDVFMGNLEEVLKIKSEVEGSRSKTHPTIETGPA